MARKAMSPMIAAVLLIVLTISMSSLVVNWLKDYTNSVTDDVDETSVDVMDCAKQRLEVSNAYVSVSPSGTDSVKATVRNTGQTPINLTDAYLYNRTGDFCSMDLAYIDVGGVANIKNNSCEIAGHMDNLSRIAVTTSCGVSAQFDSNDGFTVI